MGKLPNPSGSEHLGPCRTYDIVGRTTISLYTDICTTDLRYRSRFVGHQKTATSYPVVNIGIIPILTIESGIDIVVLTFNIVLPYIAETTIA